MHRNKTFKHSLATNQLLASNQKSNQKCFSCFAFNQIDTYSDPILIESPKTGTFSRIKLEAIFKRKNTSFVEILRNQLLCVMHIITHD